MKLYYFPLSTYSQKVLIALFEKRIEFESEQVRCSTRRRASAIATRSIRWAAFRCCSRAGSRRKRATKS